MDVFLEETMSTLRVTRLEMNTEVVGRENCVQRGIDDFGDAINGDQEEGTAEWRALRNIIFLVVGGGGHVLTFFIFVSDIFETFRDLALYSRNDCRSGN